MKIIQENGTNLTSKYLQLSGGTISGQLILTTANNPLYISSSSTTANNCINIKNNGNYNAYIGIAGTNFGGNYQNNFFIESAQGSIIFNTNGRVSSSTPNMIINTIGNVGIANTNPIGLLQIGTSVTTAGASDGNLVISKNNGTTGRNFKLGINDSTYDFTIGDFSSGASSLVYTKQFIIQSGALADTLRLTSGGGIELVYDTSTAATRKYATIGGLRIAGWDTTNTIYNDTNILGLSTLNSITFNTGISTATLQQRMIIDSSGRIGIGTNNPQRLIHVRGTNPTYLRIETSNSLANETTGIEFGINGYAAASYARITSTTSANFTNNLQFFTSSGENTASEKMTILGSGNIGIGTNNPNATLELYSTTQLSSRIILSGQEFYQNSAIVSGGIALLCGVNRTGNRQLWIGDSLNLTQNSTNPVLRINIGGSAVAIDCLATIGNIVLPLSIGNAGNTTAINGSTIN